MIPVLLVCLGGLSTIALQMWAISAAPRRVLGKTGDDPLLARAVARRFRRRMLVSCVYSAAFVGICLVYGRVLGRRNAEVEQHLRELEEAGQARRAHRPPDGPR